MLTGRPIVCPVAPPPGVGPGHVQRDRLLERRMRQLGGDPADGRCRDAGPGRHGLGAVFVGEIAFGEQVEHRPGAPSVGERHLALQRRADIWIERRPRRLLHPVPDQRPAGLVAREQAVLVAAPGSWITSQGALV